MNMVHAGVVEHPREWKHSENHELVGLKERYSIIYKKRLLSRLMMNDRSLIDLPNGINAPSRNARANVLQVSSVLDESACGR